jgi:hypothetical protein
MALLWCGVAAVGGLAKAQNGSTLYRLNPDSSFMQGCFPPCECPDLIPVPVNGTFLLTPTGFDGLFNNYAVTNVEWVISINGTRTNVTGSGTYKVGGEFALQQELSLNLQVGGGSVEHFDSGLVPELVVFPHIKATVSLHGMVCFDKVFTVSASPIPGDPVPGIAGFNLAGTSLVITGTNGMANRTYTVLTSTNLGLDFSQWTPVATNVLPAAGNFSIIASNVVDPGASQRFFLLRAQ